MPQFDGGDFVGVVGTSRINIGVHSLSEGGSGVRGHSDRSIGVEGHSPSSTAVRGLSQSGFGVHGSSASNVGVHGDSTSSTGVFGKSDTGLGVDAGSRTGTGVFGHSESGFGIHGATTNNRGVFGHGLGDRDTVGVWGESDNGVGVVGVSANGTAGHFNGFVEVLGDLTVNGRLRKQGGGFRIDHPCDPANKYLNHSFVESPEMKNVYDGVAQLDEEGVATVDLPEWFEALNGDFRYQLTAIGGAAPNLHVAEEISENRFKIAGGEGGMKVCWQVTGSRKDAWASANPFVVEQEKPEEERGLYLEPGLYDAPEEQSVITGRM